MMKAISTILFMAVYSLWMPAFAAPYDANVHFAHRIILSVPVSGEINQVNVKVGQAVNAGDILIALDKTPFEAAVVQAQATVTTHATEQREAERDFEQLQELYDRGVLSTVELENGELKYKRAKAAHDAAQAQLTQAQYDLAHSAVLAPFNGWVLQVLVAKNESVNNAVESLPLVILAEANKYIARAQVPLKAIGTIKMGESATVTIGSKTYKGEVSAISLEPIGGKNNKAIYTVDMEFDSKGALLRGGQTAQVDI